MTMRQRFSVLIPRADSRTFMIPNAYAYNPRRRLRWLQRLCCWIMSKLGAYYYDTETSVQYVEVDYDNIVRAVLDQQYAVESILGMRCKYLVLGAEQMLALKRDALTYLEYYFPPDYVARIYGGDRFPDAELRFAGLRVIEVPWANGLFVLPEPGL